MNQAQWAKVVEDHVKKRAAILLENYAFHFWSVENSEVGWRGFQAGILLLIQDFPTREGWTYFPTTTRPWRKQRSAYGSCQLNRILSI